MPINPKSKKKAERKLWERLNNLPKEQGARTDKQSRSTKETKLREKGIIEKESRIIS